MLQLGLKSLLELFTGLWCYPCPQSVFFWRTWLIHWKTVPKGCKLFAFLSSTAHFSSGNNQALQELLSTLFAIRVVVDMDGTDSVLHQYVFTLENCLFLLHAMAHICLQRATPSNCVSCVVFERSAIILDYHDVQWWSSDGFHEILDGKGYQNIDMVFHLLLNTWRQWKGMEGNTFGGK